MILIFTILVLLILNSINNKRIFKNREELNPDLINKTVVNEKTRIFCMILTQNKSLYNNRVQIQYSFSLKYI